MRDDIKARLAIHSDDVSRDAHTRIEALEAENARLKTAIATHGAEACGILRSYHQEDGTRLWLALRAALEKDPDAKRRGQSFGAERSSSDTTENKPFLIDAAEARDPHYPTPGNSHIT